MAAKKTLLSNETKIGLLAIVSIVILIWGYTYLKGRNLLSTSTLLYVEYPQVDMLATSAPVLINGFQIGVVADMYLKPENMKTIITVLDIERSVNVPKDAVAQIVSLDITGSKGIRLVFDQPCTGDACAKNGDYLNGEVLSLLGSMLSKNELNSYLDAVAPVLGEVIDTLNDRMADPDAEGLAEMFRDLKGTAASLNNLTARLDLLFSRTSGNIEGITSSLARTTATLDKNNETITTLLENHAAFSEQLSSLDLDKTMKGVDKTMTSADSALIELKQTLDASSGAISSLSNLIDGVNNGEGTLGKLLTNDTLYYQLSNASQQLELFLQDLEEKPYRYIPLKSRNKVLRYDRKDEKLEDD